jgi:hypothetical protein
LRFTPGYLHPQRISLSCPLQHLCSINMAVRRSVENGQTLAPDCRSCGTERPCTSAKTSGFAYGFGTSCNADKVQARTPTARWYSRTPGCRMSCSQRPANHSGTKPFGRNERIYKSRATFTPVESRFIFISLQQPDERRLSPFSCRGRTASPSTSSRQRVPLSLEDERQRTCAANHADIGQRIHMQEGDTVDQDRQLASD